MKYLTTYSQFEELLTSKSDRIIFKHSRTCNLSAKAKDQVLSVVNDLGLTEIYVLDVHMTDDLKYLVADKLDIKHESPQIIIMRGDKALTHASHLSITSGWMKQQLVEWNDPSK